MGQAEPLDTGNETAATEAVPEGEAPPAEAAPGEEAPPEEEAPPAEEEATAGRRGAATPGRGRRLLSVARNAAGGAARRAALAQEAVGRLNEEYLMVKVPVGARPGDMFQAVSPVTGRCVAEHAACVTPCVSARVGRWPVGPIAPKQVAQRVVAAPLTERRFAGRTPSRCRRWSRRTA